MASALRGGAGGVGVAPEEAWRRKARKDIVCAVAPGQEGGLCNLVSFGPDCPAWLLSHRKGLSHGDPPSETRTLLLPSSPGVAKAWEKRPSAGGTLGWLGLALDSGEAAQGLSISTCVLAPPGGHTDEVGIGPSSQWELATLQWFLGSFIHSFMHS